MPNPIYGYKNQQGITPVAPIPERYAGDNHPYRGIEPHGVADSAKPQDVPGYGDTVPVAYESHDVEIAPVPVFVVNQGSSFFRRTVADSRTLTANSPIQMLPLEADRTGVTIMNADATNLLYVGFSAGVGTVVGGFPLPPRTSVVVKTTDQIWVMSANAVLVGWLAEYEVQTGDRD